MRKVERNCWPGRKGRPKSAGSQVEQAYNRGSGGVQGYYWLCREF